MQVYTLHIVSRHCRHYVEDKRTVWTTRSVHISTGHQLHHITNRQVKMTAYVLQTHGSVFLHSQATTKLQPATVLVRCDTSKLWRRVNVTVAQLILELRWLARCAYKVLPTWQLTSCKRENALISLIRKDIATRMHTQGWMEQPFADQLKSKAMPSCEVFSRTVCLIIFLSNKVALKPY